MKLSRLFKFLKQQPDLQQNRESEHQAGTGFMFCLTDAIREWQKKGYTENLVPTFDHLCCRSGEIKLYPSDFYIDEMIRFENSSDPDDQSIMYAISCDSRGVKGLYIESYGTYHDELSEGILERIKYCRAKQQAKSQPEAPATSATRPQGLIDQLSI